MVGQAVPAGYDGLVTVDKLGAVPLYRQIADELAARITSGGIEAGGWLPSLRQICETYGCSRMTAERVVNELRAAGLVRGVPGRGVLVLPRRRRRAAQAEPASAPR